MDEMNDRIGRRSFLAFLSAAAATGVLPSRATAMPAGRTVARPDITPRTIAEAEKLAGMSFTPEERRAIADTINEQVAGFAARVDGATLSESLFPATTFNPLLPGRTLNLATDTGDDAIPRPRRKRLPHDAAEIAFASLAELSHWIHTKQISCVDLATLYLDRLKKYDPQLKCVITLTEDRAMQQAAMLDRELAEGRSRGPLHGIPWGAKDLFDTEGIATTFGAAPFKDRVPRTTAAVVERLDDAGAVLVAKLSLGALAYGDIWFGGRTNSPWNTELGSSGSSAGSASATAAGLVGFALGTETCGSIISPCQHCGTFGLRPTFGRVPRDGAMAL
ncbi:MAG: amidase, partial [Phycisphaerales bacterium]|nr:amidase [Phycisphaerales bacterium]